MAQLTSLHKLSDTIWELPTRFKPGMRVPARIFATQRLIEQMDHGVFEQLSNVACLPGVEQYVACMPDAHWGYGFPIGGVAAMRIDDGVISPGGIGFDINCGMRLIRTSLTYEDVKPRIEPLVEALFARVPVGVGAKGLLKLDRSEFRRLLKEGAGWCVRHGYGEANDLERTEARGTIDGADPEAVSDRAIERGLNQVGTLGSGNHYLEIQWVKEENIFDRGLAERLGIFPHQIVVMFHCGSRAFGHQDASDYLEQFLNVMGSKYKLHMPDRELACAPFKSPEGQAYFAAMNCALNMSFANRQMILHRIREVFQVVFGKPAAELGLSQVYDISHNTAKIEEQTIGGHARKLLVHRKGATRAYGPGFPELPEDLREIGQPVIIGGSMETGSYLLMGTATSSQAFHTTAHGAGRTMSRAKAKKMFRGSELQASMRQRGIYVRGVSMAGLSEEAGDAYKDVDEVVWSADQGGLTKRVAKFVPVGNIKG